MNTHNPKQNKNNTIANKTDKFTQNIKNWKKDNKIIQIQTKMENLSKLNSTKNNNTQQKVNFNKKTRQKQNIHYNK